MAAEIEAYALAAVSQAPEPFRRLLESIFGGRPGIASATDWAVTQNGTPNMSVNVAAGRGLVDGTESSSQGMYFCQSLTTTNLVISAANATNPRRDLVVARIHDNEYATGPTSAFSLEVITGTAASSPSDPTVPANCLVVARVAVAATVTSIITANITDLRTTTTGQSRLAAVGGITVGTSTARPTLNIANGTLMFETDTSRLMRYSGSAWLVQSPGRVGAFVSHTGQIINSGVTASLSWDTETTDTDAFHTGGAAAVVVPANLGGVYAISSTITMGGAATPSQVDVSILVGGVLHAIEYIPVGKQTVTVAMTEALAAGASVTLQIYNGSGSNWFFSGSFQMWRLTD